MRDRGGILLLAPVRLCWFGASKRYSRKPDLVAKIVDVLLVALVQQGHAQIVDYLTMIPSSKRIGTSSVGSSVLKFFLKMNFLS